MKIGQDMLCLFRQSAGSCTQRCARVNRVLASVVRLAQSPDENKNTLVQRERVNVRTQKLSNTPPSLQQHWIDTPCDFPIVWTTG